MDPASLEIIRQLRAMGAVRIRMGDVVIHFALPTPDVETGTSAPGTSSAVSREQQFVWDALKGLS